MNILVLIPVKSNLAPALKAICFENGRKAQTFMGGEGQVVFDEWGGGDRAGMSLEERVGHILLIRNRMIKQYLRPWHTHVVWVDADIVVYDPGLPRALASLSDERKAVTAPAVYLHKKMVGDIHSGLYKRWYDTAGFVKNGSRFKIGFPYYQGQTVTDVLVQCEGVGCFYCVPAEVYHQGAQHLGHPGFTEHLSICEHARWMGYQVLCDFTKEVHHAFLPDYGEALH